MRILTRRNFINVMAAVCLLGIGYVVATFQTKRAEAIERATTATAELWYSYELLRTLQDGDTKSVLGGMAIKADHLLLEIAEAEDQTLSETQREFRARVLTKYKSFRDAHPALYVLPSQLDAQAREDMMRTQRRASEFLKKATK